MAETTTTPKPAEAPAKKPQDAKPRPRYSEDGKKPEPKERYTND